MTTLLSRLALVLLLVAAAERASAGDPAPATPTAAPTSSTPTAAPQESPSAKRWRIRMDAFREENAHLDEGKRYAVFVGDSITEGFPLARYFEGRPVLNRGIGADVTGATGSRGVIRRLEESVFACRPAAVLLQIGINDLNGTSTPVPKVVSGVAAIVDAIRARMPEAKIVICTILPVAARWKTRAATNARVEAYDEALRALAAGRKCALVDLHAAYRGEDGCLPAAMTKDGIHLVRDAYAKWAEMVGPYVPEAR